VDALSVHPRRGMDIHRDPGHSQCVAALHMSTATMRTDKMGTGLLRRSAHGFSLIEVLVALIIISVGLLGIVKMQALSLSSTGTARVRSLAALQAASLAASMHANRGYWGQSVTPGSAGVTYTTTVTASTATVTTTDGNLTTALGATRDCTSGGADAPCTAANMAAYDLQAWASSLQPILPTATAKIVCVTANPATCTVTINWIENAVSVNQQEASVASQNASSSSSSSSGVAGFQKSSYVLQVQP
jgi:type IV pilus assembly protein PilV